ncbi:MAG: acyl-CoA thioesterase [Lachnospiraceae bacterium]|jgi:acyl-CoA thioester hydrolase|nr:acyl-CoA thioesterase [Lachnospiraceae bacterium]
MEYKVFKRRINYYETDKMQVVHHSNYIRFLEECRMDFLDQLGISYDMLEQSGLMIPVLSVSCNYRMAVRYGDTICIVPKVTRFHGVKFEMSYKIYSEDFTVLHNDATSSHCFVGMDFKPVRIKKEYPELCEKFESIVGQDLLDIE